jgi:hypothetical protein
MDSEQKKVLEKLEKQLKEMERMLQKLKAGMEDVENTSNLADSNTEPEVLPSDE